MFVMPENRSAGSVEFLIGFVNEMKISQVIIKGFDSADYAHFVKGEIPGYSGWEFEKSEAIDKIGAF